jgi:hypothetical protein
MFALTRAFVKPSSPTRAPGEQTSIDELDSADVSDNIRDSR